MRSTLRRILVPISTKAATLPKMPRGMSHSSWVSSVPPLAVGTSRTRFHSAEIGPVR